MASVCGCVPVRGAQSFRLVAVRAASAWPADDRTTAAVLPAEHRLRTSDAFRSVVRQGVRAGRHTLVVHALATGAQPSRAGFVVSKAVGNAVTRNRMKRRLRALARTALPESGIAGADHVLIGRPGGNDIAFADLGEHLDSALKRAAKKLATKP